MLGQLMGLWIFFLVCVVRNGTGGQLVAGIVRGSDYFRGTRWNDCIHYDPLLLGNLVAVAALLRSDVFR